MGVVDLDLVGYSGNANSLMHAEVTATGMRVTLHGALADAVSAEIQRERHQRWVWETKAKERWALRSEIESALGLDDKETYSEEKFAAAVRRVASMKRALQRIADGRTDEGGCRRECENPGAIARAALED